ncbi:MAG: lytic transglycosylase domain-containing protein [Pyrinomonadaceae bacterium]
MPIYYKSNPANEKPRASSNVARMRARSLMIAASLILAMAGSVSAERLRLNDGTTIEADDAWEDAQGVWYRQGGITRLIERNRVRLIERATSVKEKGDVDLKVKPVVVSAAKADDQTAKAQEPASAPVLRPAWIFLVGGARVEADEVTETEAGAWSRRGNLNVFFERARIERIERETPVQVAKETSTNQTWRARGWSTGNARLDELIKSNGARERVDPYLIFCVMEQESHFNARALSPVGARGLMQLMPGTGARFGVRRPFDPAENVRGGTRYLKQLLTQFGGRVDLVLAGYNAGEGAVMKYGGRVPPYRETRNYVQRISKRYEQNTPPASSTSSSLPRRVPTLAKMTATPPVKTVATAAIRVP